MTKPPEEFKFEISEQAKAKMAEDADAAEMVRELNARMRQVLSGIDPSDREAVGAALRSIGMEQVTDPDELARLDSVIDDEEKS